MPDEPQELSFEDDQTEPKGISEARATYNLVSDTLVGVNVRRSDNLFQLNCIGLSMLALAAVGAGLAAFNGQWELPWYGGALIGAFAGLICGTFASGIFLMVYRAMRHMRGEHD